MLPRNGATCLTVMVAAVVNAPSVHRWAFMHKEIGEMSILGKLTLQLCMHITDNRERCRGSRCVTGCRDTKRKSDWQRQELQIQSENRGRNGKATTFPVTELLVTSLFSLSRWEMVNPGLTVVSFIRWFLSQSRTPGRSRSMPTRPSFPRRLMSWSGLTTSRWKEEQASHQPGAKTTTLLVISRNIRVTSKNTKII